MNSKHQNIVKLYDYFLDGNEFYLIMENCKEKTLEHYLQMHKGVLPEPRALDIMKNIMDGYKFLYDNKIIHRDLKPSNILMSNGVAKISDFGLARKVADTETPSELSICGTPLYMAPEILMKNFYCCKFLC